MPKLYDGALSYRSINMKSFIESVIKLNTAPDTLSRAYCANFYSSSLYEIHAGLCHPDITRTYHFIKSKNLSFSLNDVRKIVNDCKI